MSKLQIGNPSAAAKLAALRARAAKPEDAALEKVVKTADPATAKERLRYVVDDSGSMSPHVEDASEGVIESLRNCIPGETSAAVHFLCSENARLAILNGNLIEVASQMKTARFGMGGTPLFGTLKRVLEATPTATRLIAFTDGSPTDSEYSWRNPLPEEQKLALLFPTQPDADKVIEKAVELRIPIDTIFFGRGKSSRYTEAGTWEEVESDEVKLLKYLSERTGGYFLLATDKAKLKAALKYLAPVNRLLLASESVRKEIEDGSRT